MIEKCVDPSNAQSVNLTDDDMRLLNEIPDEAACYHDQLNMLGMVQGEQISSAVRIEELSSVLERTKGTIMNLADQMGPDYKNGLMDRVVGNREAMQQKISFFVA